MDGNDSVDPTQYTDDMEDLAEILFQQTQARFQKMSDTIFKKIDEMSSKMDGVEKSVYDLRAELGGQNAPPSLRPDAKYASKPPTGP